jgi:TetR/AcrR family transcriptional repressor of nem operon
MMLVMLIVKPSKRGTGMGHSQAEKAASRERILDAAARQIRVQGLESLSVGELMKAAGLTHGGFYGHFESRDALVAAALQRALEQGDARFAAAPVKQPGSVKSIVNRYLSPVHRDHVADGCAVAALACDAARSDDATVRREMSRRVEAAIAALAEAMGDAPGASDAALVQWCAMIGAITLARISPDRRRSDEILRIARQGVLDIEARLNERDA